MPRSSTRMVQTTDSSIVVAKSRVKEEHIVLFSFDRAAEVTTSPRWGPKHPFVPTSWAIRSASVGTSDLVISMAMGDEVIDLVGSGITMLSLPAASTVYRGPFLPDGNINYVTVSPANWITVSLGNASGHNTLTVDLYGKYILNV